MRPARRLDRLGAYLSVELERKIAAARARGVDVISFSMGDPDRPTPAHVLDAAVAALRDPRTHRYPTTAGVPELREAIARYYRRRFEVELDPEREILPLIGSKEGIAHLATAFVDPGDVVLAADPGYPVYATPAKLAGGRPVPLRLAPERGFLPIFDEIKPDVAGAARIIWLNYPNNPTGAIAEPSFFAEAVEFCHEREILLAHDAAYVEVTFDGHRAPSVLQAPGSRDVALEFGSLSKTYNMAGWRVGWAAGAATAIDALARVKSNIDSGIFAALQRAAVAALDGPHDDLAATLAVYRRRRDMLVGALNAAGWSLEAPKGSIYVWVPTPDGQPSRAFADHLLDAAGIVVRPGAAYGEHGEGYVRFSITLDDARLEEGVQRLTGVLAG